MQMKRQIRDDEQRRLLVRSMPSQRMPLRRMPVWVIVLATLVLLLSLPAYPAAEQDEAFAVELSGRKTWTLRYGLGDHRGLSPAGIGPQQITLDQSLWVNVTGEALGMLTINAHFDDQAPAVMQAITVNLDTGNLTGVFGDFSISGKEDFAVYNKTLKGMRLDYRLGEATITGVLSLVEGISESRTFTGQTARAEVLFAASPPGRPWLDQPYRLNIAGLYAYTLVDPFIDGFSIVQIAFQPSSELNALLTDYGLGYLIDTIAASPAEDLAAASFVIITDDTQDILLLKREPIALLRTRLRAAIDAYNQEHGLTGEERKRYPLNEGTDHERSFLEQVMLFTDLVVDGNNYPLAEGVRQRFYNLGRDDIIEGSVTIEVSLDGQIFQPITDPEFIDYKTTMFYEEGIIELDFPEAFFTKTASAVRIAFAYTIAGDMFMLGLSVVPGSDRVYLNGRLLARGIDYSINYEVGVLILFVEVGEGDTIRIDYERYRGGLGVITEYARVFYGVSLDLPISEAVTLGVSLLRAADSETPLIDRERARTMPNIHTVAGITGTVNLDGFTANFTLGYTDNRFPLDNNLRLNLPNMVTDIFASDDRTFVGSTGGVSVYHDGGWARYTTADGLSGNRIRAIVGDGERVFFATASGLTVLTLEGEAPSAHVANWRRYRKEDGLPNISVHALHLLDGTLWLGTAEGLVAVEVEEIDDRESWKIFAEDDLAGHGAILALASDTRIGGTLYIGTERGLFSLDLESGVATELPEMSGLRINDLLSVNRTLYVASDRGLRAFRNGIATGWLAFGEPVYSLAWSDEELWYGSASGLHRGEAEEGVILTEWAITGLAPAPEGGVWAGSRADADYRLFVWKVDDVVTPFDSVQTGIDGRDRFRFADIDAADHTDRGLFGRAGFHREMENLTLSGNFESISPAFTAIGRIGRRDSTGWNLSLAGQPTDGVTLSASHSYHLIDRAGERPRGTLEHRASLAIDFGPQLDISLAQGAVNDDRLHPGFDSGTFSYGVTLTDSLFEESIDLALNWHDAFRWDFLLQSFRRENRISASGNWRMTPEIALAVNWGRPLAFAGGEPTGSETWGLSANWKTTIEQIATELAYTLAKNRSLPGGIGRVTQEATLGLRFNPFALADWNLTPRIDLSATDEVGLLSVSGRGTLRATFDAFSVRTTYRRAVSGLGEERVQTEETITLSVNYTGFVDLTPSLTGTQKTRTVAFRGEPRRTTTRALTGRLAWRPPGGARNDLSLSVRGITEGGETIITADLRNSYSFTYALFDEEFIPNPLAFRLDLNGRYADRPGGADINLSLTGSADLAITDIWSSSFAISYLTGAKRGGGIYHSLLFELSVAATF